MKNINIDGNIKIKPASTDNPGQLVETESLKKSFAGVIRSLEEGHSINALNRIHAAFINSLRELSKIYRPSRGG